MKEVKQILGISLVIFIIGYLITYPYGLSYSGTDKIKLISESDSIMSISQITSFKEFKNKIVYIKIWEPYDDDTEDLSNLIEKYKGKDIAFLYLSHPDSDSSNRIDDLLKWKAALKDLQLEGNHMMMSPKFRSSLWKKHPEMGENFLPHFLIINKSGKIVDFDAPPPNKESLFFELNKLLEK